MRKVIYILGALALCAFIGAMILTGSGDTLYGCTPKLALDRSTYRVGDVITMSFTLIPKREKVVRFYTEMHKNIVVEPLERGAYLPRSGVVRRVAFSADHPLVVSIAGKVVAGASERSAILDFGDYGRKEVSRDTAIELWARAYPAVIPTSDSVEWPWSDKVSLIIVEPSPNTALEPTGVGAVSSASRSTSQPAGGSAFGR